MTTPEVQYGLLSPMLIVFGVAVLGVLVEAFVPMRARRATHLVLALVGLVAALAAVLGLAGTEAYAMNGAVAIDGPTLFLQGTIVLVAIPAVALLAERTVAVTGAGTERRIDSFTPQASTTPGSVAEKEAIDAGVAQTEVFPLAMFAIGGMLLFPASTDLLTMFVALEVLSLPLYLLCGLARRRRLLSQEAALKYFLLGAFSSAFFLFGVAFLYGYAGTVGLDGIADAIAADGQGRSLALIGTALLAVGLLFKVGAVPFHSWIPDVYQGSPTPVTALMATVTKVAAFGAILRIFGMALPGLESSWRPMLWVIAIATMVLGSVVAVTQTDVKRMLAYSSVAHTGFILTGVTALGNSGDVGDSGVSATMFYLLAYAFSTLGGFAIIGLARDERGEVGDLERWAGVGRRSPLVAAVFGLFLLSFAGIPLTSGFIGKFAVFSAASGAGGAALVVVGVVCSAIAAFFYVRVIVLMFFTDPTDRTVTMVRPTAPVSCAIGVSVLVTVALGVFPQPVLDIAARAGNFL
ncbi:NADH-quinone oxidoreductase subunit NuoN [Rhodococcus sp. IEGM 1381]|uniref:NADH-quinone oxidoreductase subunit NuoN n=1 Tax=Rhodococcus sp. IEGM 1381 TaxID=3047085 RepID=UPI0024B790A6|nr:NADH-quinone oxidoreductase subunit NuoN [Rhodococcus sp. IEGM 1381]MDI9895111.1 NADH-quinone oxidoreductase subunit NuoN [Rhodococcus sp. IEGM 1381]